MNTRPSIRAAAIAALALAATPALASHIVEVYTTPTGSTVYYQVPHETYYYVEPRTTYYYEPSVAYAPPIIVDAPYVTTDQAITNDVVDVLATDPRLSGKIGVVTEDRSVRLTGRVATPGQARIAGLDAQGVDGVREVRNELRTRVGGAP